MDVERLTVVLRAEVESAERAKLDASLSGDPTSVWSWNQGYIKGLMFAVTLLAEERVLDLRDALTRRSV
jgi:hypothetical protein